MTHSIHLAGPETNYTGRTSGRKNDKYHSYLREISRRYLAASTTTADSHTVTMASTHLLLSFANIFCVETRRQFFISAVNTSEYMDLFISQKVLFERCHFSKAASVNSPLQLSFRLQERVPAPTFVISLSFFISLLLSQPRVPYFVKMLCCLCPSTKPVVGKKTLSCQEELVQLRYLHRLLSVS